MFELQVFARFLPPFTLYFSVIRTHYRHREREREYFKNYKNKKQTKRVVQIKRNSRFYYFFFFVNNKNTPQHTYDRHKKQIRKRNNTIYKFNGYSRMKQTRNSDFDMIFFLRDANDRKHPIQLL